MNASTRHALDNDQAALNVLRLKMAQHAAANPHQLACWRAEAADLERRATWLQRQPDPQPQPMQPLPWF